MDNEEKYQYILKFMEKRYFKNDKTFVMVGHDSKNKFALFVKTNPMGFVVGEFSEDKKSFRIRTEIHNVNDLMIITGDGYVDFMYTQLYELANNISIMSITDTDLDEVFKL